MSSVFTFFVSVSFTVHLDVFWVCFCKCVMKVFPSCFIVFLLSFKDGQTDGQTDKK